MTSSKLPTTKEEILDLLTHAGRLNLQTSGAAPDRPPSGACYLFDRRVCRRFRADGHGWTSRGDASDPAVAAAIKDAMTEAFGYLKEHLPLA